MNSLEVRDDLLRKLYIEDASALSGPILTGLIADVISAMNQAYQNIWTAPEDFFKRKKYPFSTVDGTSSYTLDQTLQDVLGPVTVNGATPHLIAIDSRGDFDNYQIFFKANASNTVAKAQPEAYFLERFFQDAGDPVQVNMLLAPTPDAVYNIEFEGTTEAPSLTNAEIDGGSPPQLRIPHSYVESVFLPIARYFTTRSHFFLMDRRQAEYAAIAEGFKAARVLLGDLDPQVDEVKQEGAAA